MSSSPEAELHQVEALAEATAHANERAQRRRPGDERGLGDRPPRPDDRLRQGRPSRQGAGGAGRPVRIAGCVARSTPNLDPVPLTDPCPWLPSRSREGVFIPKPLHTLALRLGDQVGERYFECRCELEEVAETRVPQPALDLADIRAMHSGKVSKSLLRETFDFAPPRTYRFAKSLESHL